MTIDTSIFDGILDSKSLSSNKYRNIIDFDRIIDSLEKNKQFDSLFNVIYNQKVTSTDTIAMCCEKDTLIPKLKETEEPALLIDYDLYYKRVRLRKPYDNHAYSTISKNMHTQAPADCIIRSQKIWDRLLLNKRETLELACVNIDLFSILYGHLDKEDNFLTMNTKDSKSFDDTLKLPKTRPSQYIDTYILTFQILYHEEKKKFDLYPICIIKSSKNLITTEPLRITGSLNIFAVQVDSYIVYDIINRCQEKYKVYIKHPIL